MISFNNLSKLHCYSIRQPFKDCRLNDWFLWGRLCKQYCRTASVKCNEDLSIARWDKYEKGVTFKSWKIVIKIMTNKKWQMRPKFYRVCGLVLRVILSHLGCGRKHRGTGYDSMKTGLINIDFSYSRYSLESDNLSRVNIRTTRIGISN